MRGIPYFLACIIGVQGFRRFGDGLMDFDEAASLWKSGENDITKELIVKQLRISGSP